ncbi:MAG: ATP-binding protein [Thermoleophilia bacterium]|nr:ATP-binding protein [Thermoleophilia bacterium]
MLPRHAGDIVVKRLGAFRVVVVTGARQVGKSTLARLVVEQLGGTYLTLDDPLTLSEAVRDADGLVASAGGLTVIDEVQRAPDVLRAVKLSVDRDPTPGRFLLTGSANLLGMRTVTESLAGRAAYLELLPLSWSEMAGKTRPRAMDDAFSADSAEQFAASLAPVGSNAAEEARQRALSGGMPEAFRLDVDNRRAWYDGYRRTFLERDLRQLSEISRVPEFGRVLSLALLRSGGLLNKSDVAADAQVSHSTVDRYLNLLQVAYQIRLLQPFFHNVAKRLVKSPKLYAVDSGAAAWAANAFDWRAAVASAKDGALLETFALSDVMAWDGLSGASRYHFWRTGAGAEVDLVIERGEQVVALEVKSTATLTRNDVSGLRALRADLGDRFRLGIVAHLGQDVRVIDRTIVAVPLASFLGVG